MPRAEGSALWAPAAERDLDDIWDYYAVNASPETARGLLAKIVAAVGRVEAHPLQGRPRGDLRSDLRSIRASPYIIFYRLGPDMIEIIRVLHERRDFEAVFAEGGL